MTIVVVAAVVERDGRFLVTRRLKGTHLAGFWEFPGGKVHDGETLEQALMREMQEELSTSVTDLREILETSHTYPERTVELHFFRCHLTGEPAAMLGQEIKWAARDELSSLEFPPADAELLSQLANARV